MKRLLTVTYGSHLYGTATELSDVDKKVVYLPTLENCLLQRKSAIFKDRFDKNGMELEDSVSMPPEGIEVEYIPFQIFCADYLRGQTYAVEVAMAVTPGALAGVDELIDQFSTVNVESMAGFAKKQVWDYVNRGARLTQAKQLLDQLKTFDSQLRLDTEINGKKIIDALHSLTGLKIAETQNNNKSIKCLELNGRQYLETSKIEHLMTAVIKMIGLYGERSVKAGEEAIDFKSVSHAVRVYEQVIEYLNTGRISFPRPNRAFLLSIKQGKADLDEVKQKLISLEAESKDTKPMANLKIYTPELQSKFELWLLKHLKDMYNLQGF